MKTTPHANRKVVWAVDLSAPDRKAINKSAAILKTLLGKAGWSVVPTYLGSSDDPAVRDQFQLALKGIKGLPLEEPKVIKSKGVYLNAHVDAFVTFAREQKAPFIALTTSARKGLARFWLGSFAETMVLHSKVPLLTVNPSIKIPVAFKTVLFPTDLSDGSLKVFASLVNLAAELKLNVVLHHRLQSYSETTGLALRPTAAFKATQKTKAQEAKIAFAKFEEVARRKGIKTKILLSETGATLSSDIVARSRKLGSSLIAMSAKSGAFTGSVVGSSARQVIRGATCPVWVLHEDHTS